MAKISFDKNFEIEIILDTIQESLDFKDELIKISNGYAEKYDFHIEAKEKYPSEEEANKIYKKEIMDILNSFEKEDIENYSTEVQERIFEKTNYGISRWFQSN